MVFVVHLDDAPWIRSPAYLTSVKAVDNLVRAYDSKWYFAGNLLGFRNGLLVLVVVCGRLEYVNIVMSDVGKNLGDLSVNSDLTVPLLIPEP
jgi:hypothetical protein